MLHLLPRFEFEDDSESQLQTVLKADEYARLQAQHVAQKRARRPGRRPNK